MDGITDMGGITDAERGLAPFEGLRPGPIGTFEDDLLGVRVADRAEIGRRVKRILALSRPSVAAQVKADFHRDTTLPRKRLEASHWPSEEDRLVYLRYTLELWLDLDGARVDPDALYLAMVDYEARRMAPHLVVSDPPKPAERVQLRALREQARADIESREYAEYLKEVEHIKGVLRNLRTQRQVGMTIDTRRYPGVYHPRTPLDPYAEEILKLLKAVGRGVSLAADFLPIIGQLKGLAEAAIGRDIFTGQKLPAWQRGLGALLALIPFAWGAFSAGKAGIRRLAAAAAGAAERGGAGAGLSLGERSRQCLRAGDPDRAGGRRRQGGRSGPDPRDREGRRLTR